MTEPRPIRDRLGELLRRERLGAIRPLWADLPDTTAEQWRLRADHIVRLAAEVGLTFGTDGDPLALPPPSNPVIWRSPVAGQNAERLLRVSEGGWEVVKIADGAETVLHRFTMQDATLKAGRALVADATVAKEPAILTELAAALTVLRLDAAGMEGQAEEASDAA